MQHWPTTPNIVLLNAIHVASVYTPCCMLLGIVARSLKPVKRLSQLPPTFILFCDPRSQVKQCWVRFHSFFHHCWGHAGILHMVSKVLWVVSSCFAGPNIVGSYCIRLHTTANKDATTSNIVGSPMPGVVASVCTYLKWCWFLSLHCGEINDKQCVPSGNSA